MSGVAIGRGAISRRAHDLSRFIDDVAATVAAARIAPGTFRRHADDAGGGADPYGCADAANILYTIGRFPRDPVERASFCAALNALQDADGLWREDTHHPIHTTAHCIAALELFDVAPARPLDGLVETREPAAMEAFLDGLTWREDPWRASHQGAGLFAALVLAGEVSRDFRARYVAWLAREADPDTGLWRAGHVAPVTHSGVATLFPHLAGTFHYLFNLEYLHAPLPHPERLIDTALALFAADAFPLGRTVGFAEIDWIYCLNRASRQTDHRFGEIRAALAAFADRYLPYLMDIDRASTPALGDLHWLFGVVCALAELQAALPGTVVTERPLKLVLDRRPFI